MVISSTTRAACSLNDTTLSFASGTTSFGLTDAWQPGTFEPWFLEEQIKHPNGAYGNLWATAFLGTGSQSTMAVSKTTWNAFPVEPERWSNITWKKSDSTTGTVFPYTVSSQEVITMAVDDTQEKIVYAGSGGIAVYNPNGIPVCGFNP